MKRRPILTKLRYMLFMVIERYKDRNPRAVGERFNQRGRMLPGDVRYHASWLDFAGTRCFQVLESPNSELLELWMSRWSDLVDFEVVPVLSSADFWARTKSE